MMEGQLHSLWVLSFFCRDKMHMHENRKHLGHLTGVHETSDLIKSSRSYSKQQQQQQNILDSFQPSESELGVNCCI